MRDHWTKTALAVALVLLPIACIDSRDQSQPQEDDGTRTNPNIDAGAAVDVEGPSDTNTNAAVSQPGDTATSMACLYPRESAAGKFTPRLLAAYQLDPSARRVFIQYRQDPTISPLPECTDCNGCRTCPARQAAIAALEEMVVEIQRCVVARVEEIGGQFLERFVLGNSTLARLNQAQAADIASLAEVSQMDDADAPGEPPP